MVAGVIAQRISIVALALTTRILSAQDTSALVAGERAQILAAGARVLDSLYVDRVLAKSMSSALRKGATGGRWSRITSPTQFADSITAALRAISHDQHVRLIFQPEDPRIVENVSPEEKQRRFNEVLEDITDDNFGVPEVRILPGNVGVLRMDNFIIPQYGAPVLTAAMSFVNNTRALIIDLRQNGGGHSDQFVLMMSYFLKDPTKLGESFSRPDSALEQTWSYAVVPGPKYATDKPVYVLTSRETFSAAEALADALRRFRHATLVGDTTRGGGHMGDFLPVGKRFVMFVPTSASTSRDDVEGVGLRPDVAMPSAAAER